MERTPTGLEYYDYRKSDGTLIRIGQIVTVHYIVVSDPANYDHGPWLDNSWIPQRTLSFKLGAGQVLKGVDEGVQGMRLSGYRRMKVPPHLAFGERGVPGLVPPGTTLYIEVYVVKVE